MIVYYFDRYLCIWINLPTYSLFTIRNVSSNDIDLCSQKVD